MKIVILGAGQVGGTLAEHLTQEDHDVTIVDVDVNILASLQERIDIRCVHGHAAHPSILLNAGIEDADILVAMTNSDETNLVACQVAYTLFRTPTKIARIRAAAYLNYDELFANEAFPVDMVISPEHLVTQYVKRLIQHPDALQVVNFAKARVQLVSLRAFYGGPLVGRLQSDLNKLLPEVECKIIAIFRRDTAILPDNETIVEPDDEIYFIAPTQNITEVMAQIRLLTNPYQNIVIAGGGNIGGGLASALEGQYNVKIIERNEARCKTLATELDNTVVLLGDASDKELLLDEKIPQTDIFCALTNSDESNIMSCILAKRLGARKVMSLITRDAYVDLIEGGEIDLIISPQQATIGSLLTHVRRGDVVTVHSLRRSGAEAIEAIAHGDRTSSQVIGKTISQIKLPSGCVIAAVIRQDEIIISHNDCMIEPEDHVVIFLTERNKIPLVEKLFQVGITFI